MFKNKNSRRLTLIVSMLLLIAVMATPALAAPAENHKCWGKVTSQRASTFHDLGQHSSEQSTPRSGLGNVARALYEAGLTEGPSVGDLGSFLASVDGLDETFCP
ncbi:MAG TPA: hypothetical protein VK851_09015 [Anaerolineales bacterium]|nr:hypothetical protein [Anaerolineales bacterium]